MLITRRDDRKMNAMQWRGSYRKPKRLLFFLEIHDSRGTVKLIGIIIEQDNIDEYKSNLQVVVFGG
jgi:hypothetical protein